MRKGIEDQLAAVGHIEDDREMSSFLLDGIAAETTNGHKTTIRILFRRQLYYDGVVVPLESDMVRSIAESVYADRQASNYKSLPIHSFNDKLGPKLKNIIGLHCITGYTCNNVKVVCGISKAKAFTNVLHHPAFGELRESSTSPAVRKSAYSCMSFTARHLLNAP